MCRKGSRRHQFLCFRRNVELKTFFLFGFVAAHCHGIASQSLVLLPFHGWKCHGLSTLTLRSMLYTFRGRCSIQNNIEGVGIGICAGREGLVKAQKL